MMMKFAQPILWWGGLVVIEKIGLKAYRDKPVKDIFYA
jgi:hypothetical protein